MEFWLEYAGFLAKTVTVVVAFIAVLVVIVGLRSKEGQAAGYLQVTRLNDFFRDLRENLQASVLEKDQLKALRKAEKRAEKNARKTEEPRQRVYVLDFDGDMRASAGEQLRHEITAILELATPHDEVVLRLESGGGMVHSYGLASAQLARLRDAQIPLTVCVDKVAASGGYMMACLGNRIMASPFAIVGSIGVVAQMPNFHRWLQKHSIDFEVLTAGEYKRTLTMFGENTEHGREKFQEDLEITHTLFRDFVARYRPQLDIMQVSTGEVWLGQAALAVQLIDELKTSDDYLATRARTADVFQVRYFEKKTLPERLGLAAASVADNVLVRWWGRFSQPRFWQ